MLSSLNLGAETQKYFVSLSNMFFDKKTWFKIWLNPGLNLTIFRGTGPWPWKVIRKTKGEGVLGSRWILERLHLNRNLSWAEFGRGDVLCDDHLLSLH